MKRSDALNELRLLLDGIPGAPDVAVQLMPVGTLRAAIGCRAARTDGPDDENARVCEHPYQHGGKHSWEE